MTTHLGLAEFVAPLVAAIKSVASSQWVAAEITDISGRSHLYLTVTESDPEGKKLAELRVQIWAAGKDKLLDRFAKGTGGESLRPGLKVLLKLRPALSPIYGLSATVEDIDASFTLGEAARKLIELRQRLQDEGLYDAQRAFSPPSEFVSVAVICPAGAAGLGDFKSHADPLEDLGLCTFAYFPATFQGDKTSESIVSALRQVYRDHRASPFDALVLLRGGGAQADLAWLNDYPIASAITKMPLPVLVAIGHERDQTILDEIANVSFHTPSKAIGHITDTIVANARDALSAWQTITSTTHGMLTLMDHRIDAVRESLRIYVRADMKTVNEDLETSLDAITASAHHAVDLVAADLASRRASIQEAATRSHRSAMETNVSWRQLAASEVERTLDNVGHGLATAQEIIRGHATTGLALADAEIASHRLLVQDRSRLAAESTTASVRQIGQTIDSAVRAKVSAVETDIEGRRLLIRDRAHLGVKAVGDAVKAEAAYVIGIGPKHTLARGFSMTRKKGKAVTRKAQIAKGDVIEVDFSDGNVEAIVQ